MVTALPTAIMECRYSNLGLVNTHSALVIILNRLNQQTVCAGRTKARKKVCLDSERESCSTAIGRVGTCRCVSWYDLYVKKVFKHEHSYVDRFF